MGMISRLASFIYGKIAFFPNNTKLKIANINSIKLASPHILVDLYRIYYKLYIDICQEKDPNFC